jgi:hypothetical protein
MNRSQLRSIAMLCSAWCAIAGPARAQQPPDPVMSDACANRNIIGGRSVQQTHPIRH